MIDFHPHIPWFWITIFLVGCGVVALLYEKRQKQKAALSVDVTSEDVAEVKSFFVRVRDWLVGLIKSLIAHFSSPTPDVEPSPVAVPNQSPPAGALDSGRGVFILKSFSVGSPTITFSNDELYKLGQAIDAARTVRPTA